MVKRLLEGFCQMLRILMGLLVVALIIPVFMQVLARYTGVIPVYLWTGEIARFIFIWIVMIGSMIAVWEGTHFDVHVIPEAKSPFGRLIQRGFVLSLIIVFAVLFARHGIDYAKFGSIQSSPMMEVNMLWVYFTVPLAGFVWTAFAGYRLWEVIQGYRHRETLAS